MTPVEAMRLRASNVALADRVAAIIAGFSGPKVWYDPSDLSTLQQDSAGTVPVASAGDPIGRILDKSGAGNHATQVTTTSRPLWQTTYAAFDGVNKSWGTSAINFTGTNQVTVIVGLRKLSDAATAVIAELSANLAVNNGSFFVAGPNGGTSLSFAARGTATGQNSPTGYPAPISAVVTGRADIGASTTSLRINGAQAASTATSLGSGNFGNYPFFIGRRSNASLPFNGNLYGLIGIGRFLTPEEQWYCERYMAQQTGIVLP